MNEYAAAVRQFYDIYRPIARKYGLQMKRATDAVISWANSKKERNARR